MTKLEIKTHCSGCNGAYHLREKYFKEHFPDEYSEIMRIAFPNGFTFQQKLYHYLNDDCDLTLGICHNCGGRCGFLSFGRGYRTYCSLKCIYTKERSAKCSETKAERYGDSTYNNADKYRRTCMEKYGVENISQCKFVKKSKMDKFNSMSDEDRHNVKCKIIETWKSKSDSDIMNHVEKIRRTKYERYGDENFNNSERIKVTKMDRYGDGGYVNPDKMKNTKLERYGDSGYVNPKKMKETKYLKYGNPNYVNVDKCRITKKERYGDANYNNREKFYETTHSAEYSKRRKEHYDSVLSEFYERGLKVNGGISKTEIIIYDYLVEMFGHGCVLTQYSSDRYPYHCDFYIIPLDLYIEVNGHWTHGGKPFVGSASDLERVSEWREKHTKYYDNAICVWTERDVEKRKCAVENGLNYVEIFSNDICKCLNVLEEWIRMNC